MVSEGEEEVPDESSSVASTASFDDDRDDHYVALKFAEQAPPVAVPAPTTNYKVDQQEAALPPSAKRLSVSRRSGSGPGFLDAFSASISEQISESGEFDKSVHTHDTGDEELNGRAMTPVLAAKETRAVRRIRFILLALMFVAFGGFAAAVFTYTRNVETSEFQETFVVFSLQITDAVQTSAQNRLEAVGALALQMEAYAFNSNSSWPFVTVPFFEETVDSMKSLTDAFDILLFPIVAHEDREKWESYSLENRHWVNESYSAQLQMTGESGEIIPAGNETWIDVLWGEEKVNYNNPDFSVGISDQIFGGWDPNNETLDGPFIYPERDFYFPQWQVAPMSSYLQSTINQNYAQFDDFYNSTVLSEETGHAVLGIAWTDGIVPGYITTMLYPIYESIHPEDMAADVVVGFLGADIYWEDYLSDILPSTATGVIVVIENNVDQTFTYRLDGAKVTFVGEGDMHDKNYDDLEETFVFGEHLGPSAQNSSHSGAYLDEDWVEYRFRIYPSEELEESYRTSQPAVYMAVVLVIAIMAAAMFQFYNWLVERRQKLVLRTAVQSDAIVSSLFPSGVKERLYQNNDVAKKSKVAPASSAALADQPVISTSFREEGEQASSSTMTLPTLTAKRSAVWERNKANQELDGGSKHGDDMGKAIGNLAGARKLEGPPIAELYEHATVFFADMVGFTSWSSDRSPADVFTLLETCYGAFDHLATRRGIFKVETIGDCYVAVSGIPVKRDDHAVIMAKFARDMLQTMSEELGKLVPVLGSSTASLAMRVGIHSGPVTAGVLRGERARFQLFGDTVNTAARMESTSVRNRIQLSESTAKLLIEAGKESWIVKREGEVAAKGKGMMQTWWLKCKVKFPISRPSHDLEKDKLPTLAEVPGTSDQ